MVPNVTYYYILCYVQYTQGLGIILENERMRGHCHQLQEVLMHCCLDFIPKCTKLYCHHLYKSNEKFQSARRHFISNEVHSNAVGNSLVENCIF